MPEPADADGVRRVAIDFKQGKILFDLPPQATLPQDVFRVMPF